MSTPSVIRIFFAIELPQSVKEKVSEFIVALKKKAKSNAVRWTKTENLHITLQFLGEVHCEHLSQLVTNVKIKTEGVIKKSSFTLGSINLFPNPYRPRVIVLDITPQEDLAAIAASIGNGMMLSNYKVEKRPFHGHLTLGRIKHPGVNLTFLSGVELPRIEKIDINEVVLFRSDPQPEGSRYTPIERITVSSKALAS